MPHQIGFVDSSGVHSLAHYNMVRAIRDLCVSAGWTVLRYVDDATVHELIMMAPGLANDQEIFVGVRTYHSVAADYYNITLAGFTGYVESSLFDAQPGVRMSGIPAHNNRIDYWLTVNGQRLALGMKVGTPVYEHGYAGLFLPYATPGQFPYPLCVAGMLNGEAVLRFSDTSANHSFGYKGNSARLGVRTPAGAWVNAFVWPWSNTWLQSENPTLTNQSVMRPTGTSYKPLRAVLRDGTHNLYGELDGVYAITGFDNATENTFTIADGGPDDGDYVVLQDAHRTAFRDYCALRLDPND